MQQFCDKMLGFQSRELVSNPISAGAISFISSFMTCFNLCLCSIPGCLGGVFLSHLGEGEHSVGPTVPGNNPFQCDGRADIKKKEDWVHRPQV